MKERMKVVTGKKYFPRWFKSLKLLKVSEIKERKKLLAAYWVSWLEENAEIIGKPDREQMKNEDAKEQNGNEEKEKEKKEENEEKKKMENESDDEKDENEENKKKKEDNLHSGLGPFLTNLEDNEVINSLNEN